MNFNREFSINFGELELRNSDLEPTENLDCDFVQIEKIYNREKNGIRKTSFVND